MPSALGGDPVPQPADHGDVVVAWDVHAGPGRVRHHEHVQAPGVQVTDDGPQQRHVVATLAGHLLVHQRARHQRNHVGAARPDPSEALQQVGDQTIVLGRQAVLGPVGEGDVGRHAPGAGVTHLLEDVMSAAVTRTIALAITTIWNSYLYKTRIFRRQNR